MAVLGFIIGISSKRMTQRNFVMVLIVHNGIVMEALYMKSISILYADIKGLFAQK